MKEKELIVMIELSQNEHYLLNAKKHWFFFFWPLFFTFITSGILSPWLIYRIARYFCDEIIITDQKFHISIGVISKNAISTPLKQINSISYSQGTLGRILGYGKLYIQSAAVYGGSGYSYIVDPAHIKATIESAILNQKDNEDKRLANYIGSSVSTAIKS